MTARGGRTYTLLVGIAAAGVLIWVATKLGAYTTWRYWATIGVLAGAGMAFALTQRIAYGAWAEITPLAFLTALVVAVICAGWIAAVGQPLSNGARTDFTSWSGDMGIRGFVEHMARYVPVIAFGFGTLIASLPTAVGRVRPAVAEPPEAEREQPIVERRTAPAPAERPTARTAPERVSADGRRVPSRSPERTRV
jgi:hypothetical protein